MTRQTRTQSHAVQSHYEERRLRRKKLNLRDNISPSHKGAGGGSDFAHGRASEVDSKTTGRWSQEEHEKFIEGKIFLREAYSNLALAAYGRDWKLVE